MKTYFEGTLIGFKANDPFKAKDTGETVSYNTATIQSFDDEVMVINTKKDFSELKGEECLFALNIRKDDTNGKLYRVQLADAQRRDPNAEHIGTPIM